MFWAPLTIYLEETENGFVTCFLLTYSVLTVTIFLGCCSVCQEIADPVSVRRLDTSETAFIRYAGKAITMSQMNPPLQVPCYGSGQSKTFSGQGASL